MTKPRRVILLAIAPTNPPCWTDRHSWIEYLVDADAARGDGERGPIDKRTGEWQFNNQFDFCKDCPAKHSWAMQQAGRCRPNHLLMLPKKEVSGA